MNKLIYSVLVFFLFLNTLSAQENIYVKALGGINSAADIDFQTGNGIDYLNGDSDQGLGYVLATAVGYRFNPHLALELEYSARSNPIDDVSISSPNTVTKGDLKSSAIMLNGFYHFDEWVEANPYIGLGLGVLTSLDYEVAIDEFGGGRSIDGNAFAFQFMLGAEIPVTENLRFFTEGRIFSASSPDTKNSVSTMNINYDTYALLFGVTFLF